VPLAMQIDLGTEGNPIFAVSGPQLLCHNSSPGGGFMNLIDLAKSEAPRTVSPPLERGQSKAVQISEDAAWWARTLPLGTVELGRCDASAPFVLKGCSNGDPDLHFIANRWLVAKDPHEPVVRVWDLRNPLGEAVTRKLDAGARPGLGLRTVLFWPERSKHIFAAEAVKEGGCLLHRWDLADPGLGHTNLGVHQVIPKVFSPSGRWLVAEEERPGGIFARKPPRPRAVLEFVGQPDQPPFVVGRATDATFSPDERHVAVSMWVDGVGETVTLWRLAIPPERPRLVTLPGVLDTENKRYPERIVFEPGGKYLLAIQRDDGSPAVFDLSGSSPQPIAIARAGVVVEAVSESFDYALLRRDADRAALLLNLRTPEQDPRLIPGFPSSVDSFEVTRDGSRMAVGASAWDLTTEPPSAISLLTAGFKPRTFHLTRDGRWLVAEGVGGTVVIDLASVPPTERYYSKEGRILPWDSSISPGGTAVIPEGRSYALTVRNRGFMLLNLANLDQEPVLLEQRASRFVLDDSGERAVTMQENGELLLHQLGAAGDDLPTRLAPLLRNAEVLLGRNLTREEHHRYLPGFSYEKTFASLPGPDDDAIRSNSGLPAERFPRR
jgi:hypothetical protein